MVCNGTIAADLEEVETYLAENGLTLVKKSRMGLQVRGDEMQILRVCLRRLNENNLTGGVRPLSVQETAGQQAGGVDPE